MAVSLVSYPVIVESGKVLNIFPGFSDVELEFDREDLDILSVGLGADNQIAIVVLGDLTSDLNVGEGVYLYAEGATYTYNIAGKIVTVTYSAPNTTITIDKNYIEAATVGYINYKQNWFLESKLVNVDNNNIQEYPQLLSDDGSPSGVVKVNTSMLVDALKNEILATSQEVVNARNKCKVMYREVWRENQTETFTLVDETSIVIVFAADDIEAESFLNKFETPKIWAGYPFLLNLAHSIENPTFNGIDILFDELDINQDDINTDNPLSNFNPEAYGLLQSNFDDNVKVIEDNTRYIKFRAETTAAAEYETVDYDDDDYLTVNTP